MKKTKKQLAIALEIIRALSPASLANAMGGAPSELCTRRPWCFPPPPPTD